MQTFTNMEIKYLITVLSIYLFWMGGCVPTKPIGDNPVNNQIEVQSNNPMVHAMGTQIVDGKNNPIKLRGVLLEGWMMWNGTLFGAGLTSETKITNRLEQLAGKPNMEWFRTAIYDHFITERDIQMIAELGFNTVRVPFNHTILEDSNPLDKYTARGWKYIDNLLTWCERHKVYVILDFHALPGGQGAFVSDPEFINVWHSPAHQKRTVEIWGAIAKRYAKRQIIAGYDLINEPDPPKGSDLVSLHQRIIDEIRKVDQQHMIFIEGGQFASSDFTMYNGPMDSNQAYSFHTYNLFANSTDQPNLIKYAKLANEHNVPVLNGEFGAHNIKWVEQELQLFEDPQYQVNGWIFWPWKRVAENGDRYRILAEIRPTEDWKQVAQQIAAIFISTKGITNEMAKKAMEEFIESSKAENLVIDQEMKQLLTKYLSN